MNTSTTPSPAQENYRVIDPDARIRFLDTACVVMRAGANTCKACIDACPSQCISAGEHGFSVSNPCMGCGQCTAACPTGALTVKGFENALPLPGGNIVPVECWKVPESVAGLNAVRVPCLGGVTPSQWLLIAEAAGNRRVIVVDRSWCAHCEAARKNPSEHPAQHALDQADVILAEAGWPLMRRPHFQQVPLPASLMPAEIPFERPASLARRAFFRRIGGEAKRATGLDDPLEAPSPRLLKAQGMQLPEREQLLETAQRLAHGSGQTTPSAPFVSLSVAPDCSHHGICAGICPTGALSLYEDDRKVGLEFNAWRCIGCGLCARTCPDKAISLHPAHRAPDHEVRQRLTAHGEKACRSCLQTFNGPPRMTTCPSCQIKQQMGSSLFGTLFADKNT